jgi:hypothetical protein
MQLKSWLYKIQNFVEAVRMKNAWSRCFILLSVFLLAVVLISFIIPVITFGRFLGTDDYTHLFHTKVMISSSGMGDFYNKLGDYVSNPASADNDYNYPFGLWLLGATSAKITGMSLTSAELLFVILFLLIIFCSFYVYSGIFLELKEQKILAVLFLLSMPSTTLQILSYRPSVFILPFLYILLFIIFKEPVQWRLFPIVWLSIFVITISHTGTFIFLISFLIVFFLLYCLLWGRISYPVYLTILSSFIVYVFSLEWFPHIASQYVYKSTIFLSPGNLIKSKLNISLPSELGQLFYQNALVNQELIYFIIIGASIFTVGKLLVYIHQKVSEKYSHTARVFPASILSFDISHSVIAAPFWLGPIHVIFAFFGFFHINRKGKCMLVSALLITLLPEIMQSAQGINAETGSLREISYLTIIIPIAAVLGFWKVISALGSTRLTYKNLIVFMVWLLVLLSVIITPILATTYYSPKIAGEDYINDGMKWLGDTGDLNAKVSGYGYRTVPIYTNMSDASYGLASGGETRTYVRLLNEIYFSSVGNSVNDLKDLFGVKYILVSEKLITNFGVETSALRINDNQELNKIYSSKDFGVYEEISPETLREARFIADNVSFQQTGSSLEIVTNVYKVVLNANNPIIEQLGSPRDNYLGGGVFSDNIQISGLRRTQVDLFGTAEEYAEDQSAMVDRYYLSSLSVPYEIKDNQIIYNTILKDQNGDNQASLLVRYTFYPTCIKREFLVSNDWIAATSPVTQNMKVVFGTRLFSPLNDFIIINNQSRLKRHMYPNLDSVDLNRIIPALYMYNGEQGIYVKNVRTSAYPTEIYYAGSTLYNLSSLSFSQAASLTPGASLHITQFLAPGDEITAEEHILAQEGISLVDYPDGIIPIMLSGYRTPSSNTSSNGPVEQGYQVLLDENIPYSEIVVPYEIRGKVDLRRITDKNSRIIARGSVIDQESLREGLRRFDNFSAQEEAIVFMIDYADSYDAPLTGYMPYSLDYNLDTLKIISDYKIPLIISRGVRPPYLGVYGTQNKNPQMASYHNSPTDVALLPVSSPMSESLSTQNVSSTNNAQVFSSWTATIDEAAITKAMILIITRSEEIGNPDFTDNFKALFAYAKDKGLTFTTPDIIADHLKNIQNIQYSGSIKNDIATINLTNNNDDIVQQVAVRIVLPHLKNGSYIASGGKIVKTEADSERVSLFLSTDIPAHATQDITIMPDTPREKIVVTLPQQPIEGGITITLEDKNGIPLTEAKAIIDSKYYHPDEKGNVNVGFARGNHTLEVWCPGYEVYTSTLNVKGRIYFLEQFFRNPS